MQKTVLVITGPTASGKTKATISLAKKTNAEVICADSRIIYKGFDIVSAKPTKAEQESIVHHLIDIIEPTEMFSAGDFVKLAEEKIENIFSRNKNVIISGGTWFYIKSLLDFKALPECPINQNLRDELKNLDNETLWNKLNSLDSVRAAQIHPNNRDKVIRSIEMCENLNAPISRYERKENNKYKSLWYMPDISREQLYLNINTRVDNMLETGLYEEFLKIKENYGILEIMKNTIGYSEFIDLEEGKYKDFNEAVEKIKQHTRNFAKRQLTYFRNNQKIKSFKTIEEIDYV